jgi:hypothetical protein
MRDRRRVIGAALVVVADRPGVHRWFQPVRPVHRKQDSKKFGGTARPSRLHCPGRCQCSLYSSSE